MRVPKHKVILENEKTKQNNTLNFNIGSWYTKSKKKQIYILIKILNILSVLI